MTTKEKLSYKRKLKITKIISWTLFGIGMLCMISMIFNDIGHSVFYLSIFGPIMLISFVIAGLLQMFAVSYYGSKRVSYFYKIKGIRQGRFVNLFLDAIKSKDYKTSIEMYKCMIKSSDEKNIAYGMLYATFLANPDDEILKELFKK